MERKERFRNELATIEATMTRQQILDEIGVNTRMGDYRNRLHKHQLAVELAKKRIDSPLPVIANGTCSLCGHHGLLYRPNKSDLYCAKCTRGYLANQIAS